MYGGRQTVSWRVMLQKLLIDAWGYREWHGKILCGIYLNTYQDLHYDLGIKVEAVYDLLVGRLIYRIYMVGVWQYNAMLVKIFPTTVKTCCWYRYRQVHCS